MGESRLFSGDSSGHAATASSQDSRVSAGFLYFPFIYFPLFFFFFFFFLFPKASRAV